MMKDKKSEQVMNIYLKGLEQDHIFQPGETIAGVVEINANEVISCRNIVVTIGWHTEGRGDRNGEDIYRDELNVTEIVPGNPMTLHFETTLPSGPWSHAGKLIRIVWEVHAKVDIAWARDINSTLHFALEPAPRN